MGKPGDSLGFRKFALMPFSNRKLWLRNGDHPLSGQLESCASLFGTLFYSCAEKDLDIFDGAGSTYSGLDNVLEDELTLNLCCVFLTDILGLMMRQL